MHLLLDECRTRRLKKASFSRKVSRGQPDANQRVCSVRVREVFGAIGWRVIARPEEHIGELQLVQRRRRRLRSPAEEGKVRAGIALAM